MASDRQQLDGGMAGAVVRRGLFNPIELRRKPLNSIKNRCGSKQKAIIAVAASMLTAVYYMLKRGEPYKELGPDYRDRRDKVRTAARLIRRVQALGFQIQLVPQAA